MRTKTHQSAGMSPVWNETFTYALKDESSLSGTLKIGLVEEDIMHNDDYGTESVQIGLLYNCG